MQGRTERPYAALILPDATGLDPQPYLTAAATILARRDAPPGGEPSLVDNHSAVYGYRYGVIVIPEEDSDYGPRVVLEVVSANDGSLDEEEASAVLSDTVLLALDSSDADILEWYTPGVLIDRDDFIRLRAFSQDTRALNDFAGLNTTDADALQASRDIRAAIRVEPEPEKPRADPLSAYRARLAATDPSERRMRAAGWAMTSTLSFTALPVAAALAIVGVFRGMDFRLATQALALTMLFVVLINSDRLSQVLSRFW